MFRISENKQFSKSLETFPEITQSTIPFADVSKISKLLVSERKGPQIFAATCILVVFLPSTNVQSHGQAAVFYLCFY